MPESTEDAVGLATLDNWVARESGDELQLTEEFPLFSDSSFTGEITSGELGPYSILNTVPVERAFGVMRPALVLRVDGHLDPVAASGFDSDREDDTYHGGTLADEIAALVSLGCGVRAWAGGSTRTFWPNDADPRGRPSTPPMATEPHHVLRTRSRIMPGAFGNQKKITGLLTFSDLAAADAADAIALVKAARLYQHALWVCESEPQLAWVFLVSAVEVVAGRWFSGDLDVEEILRREKPDLVRSLEEVDCEAGVPVVAAVFGLTMRATHKFKSFSLEHLPEPPPERPLPVAAQVDWTQDGFRRVFSRVYKLRSRALHEGVQFPFPMCKAPYRHKEWPVPEERPMGGRSAALGAVWTEDGLPIHLWVYGSLVRHSILEWWTNRPAATPYAS